MFIKFIFFISVLLPSLAIAQNSAGGRGGGTGVSCKGKAPITLEEYEMSLNGDHVSIPGTRAGIRMLMKKKLKNYPEFFEIWLQAWKALESYDRWPTVDYDQNTVEIANALNERLAELNLNKPVKPSDFNLESDDIYKAALPSGCEKIQLSLFDHATVYKIDVPGKISEQTKRILELHESLYFIGTNLAGHVFADKTRTLIKNLFTNPKEIGCSLYEYVITALEKEVTAAVSGSYLPFSKNAATCPASVIVLAPPGEELILMTETIGKAQPFEEELFGSNVVADLWEYEFSNKKLNFSPGKESARMTHLTITTNNGEKCDYSRNVGSWSNGIVDAKIGRKIFQVLKQTYSDAN